MTKARETEKAVYLLHNSRVVFGLLNKLVDDGRVVFTSRYIPRHLINADSWRPLPRGQIEE